MPIVQGKKSEN